MPDLRDNTATGLSGLPKIWGEFSLFYIVQLKGSSSWRVKERLEGFLAILDFLCLRVASIPEQPNVLEITQITSRKGVKG